MILADEADVLEEAFFRADVSDVSALEYREQDLEDYAEYLHIERDILPDIRPYFSISEEQRCEQHGIPTTSCGCGESRQVQAAIYHLDPEALVEDWVAAVRDSDTFDSIELEKIDSTRYVLKAWLDRTKITFQCFFDGDEMERHDFKPQAMEFGVSFFGDQQVVEREHRYSWREFLEDDFRDTITTDVKHLKEAIGSDFYEYRPLEEFRDRVRQSLRDYFSESGYEVRREVGEVCAVETTQYGIDTGKTDFAARRDGSKFIVCHCEKTPGWHVHHFSDGRIESAEQTPIIEDMTEKIEGKINTYQDIRLNKQTASKFVTLLATFFSIGFVVLFLDRLGLISSVLREQFQLGGSLHLIAFGLLIFDALAAIALAAVVTRPYVRDALFSWKIEPFDGDDRTT
ncbi:MULTISPECIES: hypothetical protein [Halobacteriales]|uniref:Uncharacterized protein n=1 Tax=Halobaculum roseum TaxID=2175149 RepID=A0ABD5MQX9_9EURY|nr:MULTISPECIES: hypothetical protein [Halobacteria]QZY04781.1 hypothetical protein K6T36_18780 [Halobaculum roseum]